MRSHTALPHEMMVDVRTSRAVRQGVSLLLVGLVAQLVPAVSAFGDVTVTTSATAPTADVIASHTSFIGSFFENWSWFGNTGNDHRDLGQSFLVSGTEDVDLNAVTVMFGAVGAGAPGSDFTLEIWTMSSAADGDGDTLIDSQSGTLPVSGLGGATPWTTFAFDDVTVSPGQHYLIILAFDSGPVANRSINFREDFSSGYGDGRSIGRNGTPADWSVVTNDLVFIVQGAAVPSLPMGTAFFVIAGLVLLLAATRVLRASRRNTFLD